MTLQLTRQTLSIAGHEIIIELPTCPDQLLEAALQFERQGSGDWDPYWGSLWPAVPKTAAAILQHTWPSRLKALELGCGIGVAGIAARIAGHDVTFADHASAAVNLAVSNAALNGFTDTVGMRFDWQYPPSDHFDFILASDVLYDAAGHRPLLRTLRSMLGKHGIVWIGDPGRANALQFSRLAVEDGWCVELCIDAVPTDPASANMQFQMFVMRRSNS